MPLTLSIFSLTVVLILWRPRPLNEGMAASLGAFLLLATRVVTPEEAWGVLGANLNVVFFFLGLMVISGVAERAGFFDWCAFKAARLSRGNGKRLLLLVFIMGTPATAFFSNDTTALVLTPVVFAMVTRLKLNPLPYVFACAFIANTASLLLPVSNPVNLLPVDAFRISLPEYLGYLLLPSLFAIAINIALFFWLFRKGLASRFRGEASSPWRQDAYFWFVCGSLGLIGAGYILASLYALPLSYPALAGAALLVAGGLGFRRLHPPEVTSGLAWAIFPFILGLAIVVKGIEKTGLTSEMGEALARLSSGGALMPAILTTALGNALGSNLINNWSMMMVSVASFQGLASFDRSLIYASILGADVGPNLTIIGPLSSILWITLLRHRGLDIHPLQYIKLGLLLTPPMLLAGALSLYLSALLL